MSEAALASTPARAIPKRGLHIFYEERPRVLVLWPNPRAEQIWECLKNRDAHEQADAFTYLRENGLGFSAVDPFPHPLNPLLGKGSTLSGLDLARALYVLANCRQFDALVSMDTSSCLFFVIAKRLFGLRKPVIVVDPAMDLNSRIRRWIHSYVLRRVDAVVVFGTAQMRFLDSAFGGKVKASFVRHRMDSAFFDATRTEAAPEEKPYILSVGEDSGRDFETLLQASEGANFELVIRTGRSFNRPVPPNVTIQRERTSFETLRDLYAKAALVVLPLRSTLHASGINTLLEGMSMAKAVIVSGSEGIVDYVEHGRNACVVAPGDPVALRAAIDSLLGNPAETTKLGQNARQYCEAFCSMRIYMRRVSAIVHSALKASQPVQRH